jgi:glycosyltransferase involved in cell wall biosynthesis
MTTAADGIRIGNSYDKVNSKVSILICTRNAEKYIKSCIKSILDQKFSDFEIVIVDEYDSNSKTKQILNNFADRRIKYFKNDRSLGISKSRNNSVKYSRGEYLFFTDSDCIVSPEWIEQGVKSLENHACLGVEGKSYYVSMGYKPTFSDHTYVTKPGAFMTNNIAYKRSAFEKIGGFDEKYSCHEDRDLGLRILQLGSITFNPDMIVNIQQETLNPMQLLKRANAIKNRVYLFKRFHDKELLSWRIIDIYSLLKIVCPLTVFTCLMSNRFKTSDDYRLVPFTYIYSVLERLRLWKECAKERVFLI